MQIPSAAPSAAVDPTVYFDDELLLTRTEAWTWVEVPSVPFAFTSRQHRVELGWTATLSLAALREGDLRVKAVWEPRDVTVGAQNRDRQVRAWGDPAAGWPGYLRAEQLAEQNVQPLRKRVLLGVRLGQRSLRGQLQSMFAREPLAPVSAAELERWGRLARSKRELLARGGLATVPLDAAGLRALRGQALRRLPVEPSRTGRRCWGAGEVTGEFADVELTATGSAVRVVDGQGERLVATLVCSAFPVEMSYPQVTPWLAHLDRLPFPVEAELVLSLRPPDKARQDVKRRNDLARDQAREAAAADHDLPIEVEQIRALARQMEFQIPKRRMPLAYGWVRLRIDADSAGQLADRQAELVEHMAKLGDGGIDVAWPRGQAQLDLLLEGLPGVPVRHRSWRQRWLLETVACSLPWAGSDLGTPDGALVGHSTGRAQEAVRWSPWWAQAGVDRRGVRLNRPSGFVLLGNAGAGKSSALTQVAFDSAMSGAVTVAIDPSGPQGRLVGLEDLTDRSQLINLMDAADGSVDPMSNRLIPDARLTGDVERDARAMARVRVAREQLTREQFHVLAWRQLEARPESETEMLRAISAVASGVDGEPSSAKVLERLSGGNAAAQYIGEHLRHATAAPEASAAFGEGLVGEHKPGARRTPVLTVLTMPGIVLPEPGQPMREWLPSQALGATQMNLAVVLARRLLFELDWQLPKLLTIDEAHVPLGTPSGSRVIESALRDGRKRYVAVGLSTHNAVTVGQERLLAQLSTRMQFRTEASGDVEAGLAMLGVELTRHNREQVPGLRNGECLVTMPDGARDRMMWDRWYGPLRQIQDTTPGAEALGMRELA